MTLHFCLWPWVCQRIVKGPAVGDPFIGNVIYPGSAAVRRHQLTWPTSHKNAVLLDRCRMVGGQSEIWEEMENAEMNLDKILSPDFWCYSYVLCQTYCLLHIKVPQVVVLPLPDMWVVACSSCCICLCTPLCWNGPSHLLAAISAPTIHPLSPPLMATYLLPLCLFFPQPLVLILLAVLMPCTHVSYRSHVTPCACTVMLQLFLASMAATHHPAWLTMCCTCHSTLLSEWKTKFIIVIHHTQNLVF